MLLHPAARETPAIALEQLSGQLRAIGLIDEPRPLHGDLLYPVGEQFLQLVTFLGCSPAIELVPPDDLQELEQASMAGRFCHVFLQSGDPLRFRHDSRTRPPLCPQCRSPEADWQLAADTWQDGEDTGKWSCRVCGFKGCFSDLVFRKTAGFSRTFVEIRGIYPAEAVPGPALLDCLQSLSGGPWTTIYLRE